MHIPTHTKARKMERNQRARGTMETQLFFLNFFFFFGAVNEEACAEDSFFLLSRRWNGSWVKWVKERSLPCASSTRGCCRGGPNPWAPLDVFSNVQDWRSLQADFSLLKTINSSSKNSACVTPEWLHRWRLATLSLGPHSEAKQRWAALALLGTCSVSCRETQH